VIRTWRIVDSKHAPAAFDGEGARLVGGRWNSSGTRTIYISSTTSLAVLEMLAHLQGALTLPRYVLIACDFDGALVEDVAKLPEDWRRYPAPPQLQLIGDQWARSGWSTVLRVPSAIVDEESNYLLNPEHRDFSKIKISESEPFALDLRLLH
jgi:RES domain-containing protein